MKNKATKSPNFVIVVVALLIAAVGFTFFTISSTLNDLSVEVANAQTDVTLASAEYSVDSSVSIPVNYFSQVADPCINLYDQSSRTALENRQFEWNNCGYVNGAFEQGLIESKLSAENLPIAANSGSLLPNRGLKTENFSRWFNSTENLSVFFSGLLDLKYDSAQKTFSYESWNFYPLKSELFTMSAEVPFSTLLSGSEEFSITADDDTWVFIDDSLVLDLGGIHGAMSGKFSIRADGRVFAAVNDESESYSGVSLSSNQSSTIRIFHANRNSSESVFKLNFSNMHLNVFNTTIAYNEDGSAYIPPLGESTISSANYSSALLTSVIAQFFILGILLVLSPVVVDFAIRHRRS